MPTVVAVVPHPDDEAYSMAGTLALAARAGWRCIVVAASAGEKGTRHDGGNTSPADVGAARRGELAASCAVIGADPPVFWGLPDGALGGCDDQAGRFAALVHELAPDVILALGPDGAYGHPDHLAVHRWVVRGWESTARARPLLLAAFPPGLFVPQWERCRGMMGEPPNPPAEALGRALPHYRVRLGHARTAKLRSISAHRSQLPGGDPAALFPPGIVDALLAVEWFSDARGSADPEVRAILVGWMAGNRVSFSGD